MIARRILAGSILLASLSAHGEPPNPKIVARYKEMLAAKPAEGTALDRLWQIFLDQNQTAELIAGYQTDNTFPSQMVLGQLLRKAAQPVEAAAAFENASKLDPKSPLPWLALARLRGENGAPKDAAGALENALSLFPEKDPQQAETLMQLGTAWLAAGDITRAAEAWERTVALDPANLDLRRRLATVCVENHLPDRALAHLDFLVKNAPPQERAQALQQMARIYQGTGAQDEAIAALERALALTAPGNWLRAELQSQIVRLHQRYHRVPELERRWRENVLDNPRDISAYLQIIDLYERTGELDRQREWLTKLAALAPKTPEYRIKLARLLVHMDDLDGAITLYDALLKEQPANVDLVFERARLDVQHDQMDAARARIAALLQSAKGNETVRAKAVEFYETHRLNDLLEAHLKAEAAGGAEEPVLALANFLFAQKREAEAQAALDRLVPANASKEVEAAALFKKAQILKTQNELPVAASTLRKAIPLAAEPRDLWLLLGEIETALGKTPDARLAFEQAVATSRKPAERIDADQKLFESFRAEPEKSENLRRPFTLSPIPGESPEPNTLLQSYLLGITRAAAEKPTIEGWLRVARWHLWSRSQRPAIEYAQKALALAPDSIEVRELLVKLTSPDPRSTEALVHLAELERLDPARRAEYRRRAGQIELQAGRVAEAERIFTDLTKETPGNIDALTDLALTQQRAEAWEKALATWRQIVALSPASRKKEATGPLLRVFEKLNRHQEAAALLLSQIDSIGDERDQLAAFNDLLNLCAKQNLMEWLRGVIEARRKLRADDYFTEIALGRVLKATGNKAAAFEVLADASFAAENQAEALPELIREAEELRKLDAAVRLQTQLVRILPDPGPTALGKLAQLQEKSADLDGSGKTWERIVAKFPRDAATLEQAVAFQIRWGASVRAAELLRRIRALDPANLRVLAQLAQLDIDAGQIAEAQQCLEQILAQSTPEKSGDPLRIPVVKVEEGGRLQSDYLFSVRGQGRRAESEVMRALSSFWVEDVQPGRTDRDLRLAAIRNLGILIELKGAPAATSAWVQRWRTLKTTPTESLWALFFAGASGPLLDHVDELLAEKPTDVVLKQGFIWLALQTGEFERLGAWHLDKKRTPGERDYLLIALGQHLQTRPGKIEPGLVEKLFPPGYLLRAWQTASLFGNRGNFREAAQLGERVFRSVSTQRARYGLDLAHWHLQLGEIDTARRYLHESLDSAGESFESPVYSALREYYLLLPAAERAGFAESFLKAIDPSMRPLHATLSRALLAGLAGREDEARTH
ncbi:MAG: tetratricopeptide repeat protein, partial [Chthoniobacteraceae bacterium]